MASPTARTLYALRRSGYEAEPVERWIPTANIRKDLFGIGDVIAVRASEPGALLIQCTTLANLSSRRNKAAKIAALRTWLAAGNRFELWGWHQDRNGAWQVRREALNPDTLAAVPVERRASRRRKVARGMFDGME